MDKKRRLTALAAALRASEVEKSFSHTRPGGAAYDSAMGETGAKSGAFTWGENIAAGNSTAAATVEQWMDSPGHRANILNRNYTHMGVGNRKTDSGYRYYWVQMFIGCTGEPERVDPGMRSDGKGGADPMELPGHLLYLTSLIYCNGALRLWYTPQAEIVSIQDNWW